MSLALITDWGFGVLREARLAWSAVVAASRSPGVIKFFINSARSVGDAPLIERPLMYVTFPVLEPANRSSVGAVGLCTSEARFSGSDGTACLTLTAVKPTGGDCDVSMLRAGPEPVPFGSAGDIGEPFERSGACFTSPSPSRRAMMALRLFFILWISCRARAETWYC